MLRRSVVALACALVACSGGESNEVTTTSLSETSSSSTTTTESHSTTTASPGTTSTQDRVIEALVFHKTTGFHHGSIEAGIETLEELGSSNAFAVTATDDDSVFDRPDLARFGVIVFLNTTGDVLDPDQQDAMESYIRDGNGFVGIHAAADTEYDWDWYGGLLGTYFESHPEPQNATVTFVDPGQHPVTEGIPTEKEIFDEWYNFRQVPGPGTTILATLDEASYEGGTMGAEHPIAWAHEFEGGRSVYIGFGHFDESFRESVIQELLTNSIVWAADS